MRLNHGPVTSLPCGSVSVSGPESPCAFHSLQEVAQAWQPTQVSRSMTSPSFLAEGVGSEVIGKSFSDHAL